MSSPSFQIGRRKNSPPFGGFTPVWGGEFSKSLFFVYAAQFLRWPWLSRGGEKRGGIGGSPPHKVHGGQPSALLALLKAGNCHNPYLDTVENGSTLGKSGIHDTQFDAKAPKPTPKNRKIDPLEKSLNDRLCRAK